jgi:hypothetical protein
MFAERFQMGDVPPDPPTDCFFKFEATTQYLTSVAPFEIGNFLLDFFNKKVDAVITKVRRPKFAIKVDVFSDTVMCTTKVRVYSQGSGRFAIEFQRRSGDTISFNATYQQVCRYLQQRLNMEAPEDEPLFNFVPLPIPDDALGVAISEAEILPLLDMTSLVGAPWLQAEAAASLSKMAAESNPVLWSPRVFQGIEELLQVISTDVSYPTACLIEHLSQQAGAVPRFASEGFLPAVLDKATSPQSHPQVRNKLARALRNAIPRNFPSMLAYSEAVALLSDIAVPERLRL